MANTIILVVITIQPFGRKLKVKLFFEDNFEVLFVVDLEQESVVVIQWMKFQISNAKIIRNMTHFWLGFEDLKSLSNVSVVLLSIHSIMTHELAFIHNSIYYS